MRERERKREISLVYYKYTEYMKTSVNNRWIYDLYDREKRNELEIERAKQKEESNVSALGFE